MAKKKKLINELVIFGIGLGILLGILAAICLAADGRGKIKPWGFDVNLALGIPIAVIASLHVLSAIILAITKSKFGVYCCIASGFLVAIFYAAYGIEVEGTVYHGGIILAAPIYSISILLVIRGTKTIAKIDDPESIVVATAVEEVVDATIVDDQ